MRSLEQNSVLNDMKYREICAQYIELLTSRRQALLFFFFLVGVFSPTFFSFSDKGCLSLTDKNPSQTKAIIDLRCSQNENNLY